MICHSYAPTSFIKSSIIPIPKGARANLTDSDKYRSIAISSLLSKLLDYVIIKQQNISLKTSDYQFGCFFFIFFLTYIYLREHIINIIQV